MPKIPNEVKIGSVSFTVRIIPDLKERTGFLGQVNLGNSLIEIDGDMPKDRQYQTFIHELTHAIIYEAGDFAINTDEQFVSAVANRLTDVLLNNDLTKE